MGQGFLLICFCVGNAKGIVDRVGSPISYLARVVFILRCLGGSIRGEADGDGAGH